METRVLPTMGDEASSLRAAVAALHGALDRRDARALSSGIGGVLEAARAMTANRADVAYELEPLALSLKQISAVLPTSIRCADEDYSITRGER